MRAHLIDKVILPDEPTDPRPRPGGGWLVTSRDDPRQVTVLDSGLRTVRRLRMPDVPGITGRAVDPTGRRVAVSRAECVQVNDGGSADAVDWRVEHGSWDRFPVGAGACVFSLDGTELWATVRPREDLYDDDDDEDDGGGFGGGDECWVLDAVTGERLGRTELISELSFSSLLPHPDGRHMGVLVGEGQDGSFGHWVRREGRRIVRTPTDLLGLRDRSLAAIAPDGRHYLNQSWTTLSSHAFPTAELVAERPIDGILPEGPAWRYGFAYYDASTVLATFHEDGPAVSTTLLRSPSLEPLGEIAYPDGAPYAGVASGGDGSWVTVRGNEPARWSFEPAAT
ncbi:hypothetical protein [Kitasatospora sp. NPDC088346]|uniref:hypothetical protein n=1 Tax=Kitasatospora sp. NPDC088346 TaxID=3364073 RepID=UPI0037F6885D